MLLQPYCYSMKLDLLTNATVVDDAIRFVSSKSKEKQKSCANDIDDREELDEDARHEETRETNDTPTTTNYIF